MASFLVDRHSPIRSGIAPKLRHRSRYSESENAENPSLPLNHEDVSSSDSKNHPSNDNVGDTETDCYQHCTEKKTAKNKSMLSYFMTELTRDYKLEGDASEFVERRDRIYTSVNTPKNLEKFCAFGFLQCLDSILYMVTFLPLRIIVAIVRVLIYPCAVIFMGTRRILDGAQVCDLLKGVVLIVSCFITSYMDMSMIYHIVRGQSIIKFYVFYNMLDVMDKLVSGFGQDVLDSLYWTAVEPRGRKREHFGTIFHLIFAIVYVVVHTVMILIQAIILNVAFNSHNKNLLTIMMSNNFVEIKGNLFKRLDKNNLCQITYGDVKERFHYLVLLLFVFIRNMKELQWSWEMAFPIIQDAAIVMVVEVIVDWIKHAFITKFNELSASSYADFALGLAQDIATSQKKHAFTNFSDQVCRRMGFTPIPLICLLFMVCSKSFNINGPLPWLLVFLFYLCLMSTKVLISIILLGWAQRLINERDKTTKSTATVVNSQVVPKKEDKASSARAKSESLPEMPVPLIIAPHPTPVSSSIAVNTGSALSLDSTSGVALISSHPEVVEISTSPSTHNGKLFSGLELQVSDCPAGDSSDSHSSPLLPQWHKLQESEEQVTASPISGELQQLSSLYTKSSLPSDALTKSSLTDQFVAGDAGDGANHCPVKMDFQLDFLNPEQPSASGFTVSDPVKCASDGQPDHSSFPASDSTNIPQQKHPEAPTCDEECFFHSVDSPELQQTTASELTSQTTASALTSQTTASALTSQTTASALTSQTTASELTSQTTGSALTSRTTASALTSQTMGSAMTSQTTGSALTSQTTVSALTSDTLSVELSETNFQSKTKFMKDETIVTDISHLPETLSGEVSISSVAQSESSGDGLGPDLQRKSNSHEKCC